MHIPDYQAIIDEAEKDVSKIANDIAKYVGKRRPVIEHAPENRATVMLLYKMHRNARARLNGARAMLRNLQALRDGDDEMILGPKKNLQIVESSQAARPLKGCHSPSSDSIG